MKGREEDKMFCLEHIELKMPVGQVSADTEKALVLPGVSKVEYYTSGVYEMIPWVWAKPFHAMLNYVYLKIRKKERFTGSEYDVRQVPPSVHIS